MRLDSNHHSEGKYLQQAKLLVLLKKEVFSRQQKSFLSNCLFSHETEPHCGDETATKAAVKTCSQV